jgi:copper chaperone
MTQLIYSVPNISCGHCVASITNELKEIEGVKNISGDPQTKTITLELTSPATDDQVKAKLAEIGYPAD